MVPAAEAETSDLLRLVVEVAVPSIGGLGAASISLTTTDPAGYRTICATSEAVREVDELQYREGGPCVHAIGAADEVMLALPSRQWPVFSEAATGIGMSAVWSLPLPAGTQTAGALNLYARRPAPWDDDQAGLARTLAAQAAMVLTHAQDLARAEQTNLTLRRALETRTVIGQAQGVLMARQGITADEAFDILRRASQRTNRKLRDIAGDIVGGLMDQQEPN